MDCTGCTWNIRSTILLTQQKDQFCKFLQNHNLAQTSINCTKCLQECYLDKSGKFWRCQRRHKSAPRCNFKKSARTGSILARSHLTPSQIITFVVYWLILKPPRQNIICSEIKIKGQTYCEWSAICRQVCMEWNGYFSKPIGGPGKVVEIDEAVFGKKQDRRGRNLEQQWVFGGVQRGSSNSKFFLQPVNRRDALTLFPIILNSILPGTTVMSDGWKAYYHLNKLGFKHLVVNHKLHFVDPKTRAHTQNIERLWRDLRNNIPRFGRRRQYLAEYVAEYAFKRAHPEKSTRLHDFLIASNQYVKKPILD